VPIPVPLPAPGPGSPRLDPTALMAEDWTIAALSRSAAELLAGRGADSPRLDADLLLGHVLERTRMQLYLEADRPVTDDERAAFRELVRRRATGEPIAYLLGERGFWTLDLAVDPRVLVPRPETERIVELALEWIGARRTEGWRVVDVGTGSGALALALASELPAATVLATDVSPDALEVAAANAESNALRDRVRFTRADLLGPLVKRGSEVDLIVSNPPYIGERERAALPRDVVDHEPGLALFSGPDGLDAIRRLLPQAARVLRPGGLLLVEIGSGQGAAVAALARECLVDVRIVRDHAGRDRVLWARRAGGTEADAVTPRPIPADARSDGSELERVDLPPTIIEDPDDVEADGASSEAPDPGALALEEARAAGLPVIDLDASEDDDG